MTILAAIDETNHANRIVSMAHELAEAYGDDLTVLHVIPEDDYEAHKESLEGIPGFEDFSFGHELENAAEIAQKFVEQAIGEDEHINVESIGRVGDVAEEIVTEANRINPRFLVIGGRRRSPVGKAIFGDVTQQIILNAGCPVVTNIHE